jgi:methylamine---corrinoid protein Co-methyltransferase
MIPTFLDILDRAHSGPKMTRKDWDFDIVTMLTRNLVKKYNLSWDKHEIIPGDPSVSDRVFQAGLELAIQAGVYCMDTGRIIQFEPGELENGIDFMPEVLVLGEGKDARTLIARTPGDSQPPIVWAGNPGAPIPEELFMPMVLSWLQEPIVDLITCGSLTHVDGHVVYTGEPTEIIATRREVQYMREAMRRSGRPGMGMLGAQSSLTELGDLAVAHPDYLRPSDSHLVPMLNEMTTDFRNLSRAANSLEYGMHNASLATVMVGGLGGNAPGAAVVQTASLILSNLVCQADYHLLHPIHLRHVATSTRGVLWMQSVVLQAFGRNAPCIIVGDIYPKSGAMTPELLYETAANAVVLTASGGHLEGVGSADGALPNSSGLEARLMGEVGYAVVRQNLSLVQANKLALSLVERYEHVFDLKEGNPGVRFDEAYDLATMRPVPAWQQIYDEVKKDLRQMGLKALD